MTTDPEHTQRNKPRLYGRSGGRPLSRRQEGLAETLLPRIAIPETPLLDPRSLFETPRDEIWLEIGFGGGEHLAGQAVKHPQVGLLGAEPFLEGFGRMLSHVADNDLANVRLRRGDARLLVDQLAPTSISRVFILFPDPWPKTRHRKRRIVQTAFLDALARVLVPGTRVRFATDVADYASRALHTFISDRRYQWQANAAADWRDPPADHVTTRYQEKRLGDCAPVFFDFVFTPATA